MLQENESFSVKNYMSEVNQKLVYRYKYAKTHINI